MLLLAVPHGKLIQICLAGPWDERLPACSLKDIRNRWMLGAIAYSLLKIRIFKSRMYRGVQTDQTIEVECKRAFLNLLQNLIQWFDSGREALIVQLFAMDRRYLKYYLKGVKHISEVKGCLSLIDTICHLLK